MNIKNGFVTSIFVVTTFILVFSFGMASWNMYNFNIVSHAVNLSDETITVANELTLMLVDAETGQRGYIITGDDEFLDIFHYGTTNIPAQLALLTELTQHQPNAQLAANITALTYAKLTEMEQTLDVRKNSGFPAAQVVVGQGVGKKIMDDLRDKVALLVTDEHHTMIDYQVSSDSFAHWAILGLMLGIISFFWLALSSMQTNKIPKYDL